MFELDHRARGSDGVPLKARDSCLGMTWLGVIRAIV